MKRGETREHMEVHLQRPAACTVSFARGAERTVMFAVHGVPQVGDVMSGVPRGAGCATSHSLVLRWHFQGARVPQVGDRMCVWGGGGLCYKS